MTAIEVEFPSANVGASKSLGHFVDEAAFERFADAYRRAALELPSAVARTIETASGPVRCYRFTGAALDPSGRAPIVLLSGRNAATPMWAPAMDDLLALGRPLYSIDSLGEAGCSSQKAPLETVEDQVAWVAEALTQLGLREVHLVGHSLGGWLAAQVAMRRPALLGSVTTLDPPRVFTELSATFVLAGLAASSSTFPAAARRRMLGWIAGGPMVASDPLDQLGWAGLRGYRVRQLPPQLPSSTELGDVEVPLLAILAGRSRVHDAQAALRGAARVPGSQAEVWADVGHALHAEQPQRLAARLRTFVDSTGL